MYVCMCCVVFFSDNVDSDADVNADASDLTIK